DERQERREVVRLQVDLAALERGEHDLARAEVELARDGVPVGLEDLAVQLAKDELLAEVRRADRDCWFRSARAGTAAGARDKCRHDEGDRDADGSLQLGNSFRAAAHISRPSLAVSPAARVTSSQRALLDTYARGYRGALECAERDFHGDGEKRDQQRSREQPVVLLQRAASDGIARPMFATFTATKPKRPVCPRYIPTGSAMSTPTSTARPDTSTCSRIRVWTASLPW